MPRKHGTSCFQRAHGRSEKSRKSPSTRARNRLRLERFLAKKKASAVPASSSPEPVCGGCPLEPPGVAPNQTAPDEKGRTSSEINLPTTSQASEGQRRVLNGSGSKRISEIQRIQQAAEANALECETLLKDMEKHMKLSGSLEENAALHVVKFTRRQNASRLESERKS